MTKYISLVIIVLFALSCSKTKFESHDHSNGHGDAHAGHGDSEIESIRFTEFSNNYELFAEMTPMIVNKECQFVVHFTKLSDFKPIMNGRLQIVLKGAINDIINVDSIARAGIFLSAYTPKATGDVDISFIYSDEAISDTINVSTQKCYNNMEAAKLNSKPAERGISFLKEESWKIDFALHKIVLSNFSQSIKATGKIQINPADELVISATASGVIDIIDNSLSTGRSINSGTKLFSIKPGSIREDNFNLKYQQAKSNLERAKKEFERNSELFKLKIITEKEYLAAKSDVENSQAIFNNYSNSSDGKNISIKSSKSGYLNKLYINEGQFVEAGMPLAIVSNTNKLIIQVDIPINDYYKFKTIKDANFIIGDQTINMKNLNGKIVGKPIISSNSSYATIPIQIDNKINLLPNTLITVYLIYQDIPNSIIIPKESIWEDTGIYYVFMQKHGELFEKREVKLNGFDGCNYLVSSGLMAGNIIVSKGTKRVMLASSASNLPTTSHAH